MLCSLTHTTPVALPYRVPPRQVLAKVFGFQPDSVLNQRDNAISMLASRLSRWRHDTTRHDKLGCRIKMRFTGWYCYRCRDGDYSHFCSATTYCLVIWLKLCKYGTSLKSSPGKRLHHWTLLDSLTPFHSIPRLLWRHAMFHDGDGDGDGDDHQGGWKWAGEPGDSTGCRPRPGSFSWRALVQLHAVV